MTDTIEALNTLINGTFTYLGTKIIDIIDVHDSHSTDSFYLIVQTKDGVYQVSFSDHYSHTHDTEFDETDLDDDNVDELQETMAKFDGSSIFERDPGLIEYFGIQKATKYDIDPTTLIGNLSLDRAYISDSYKIVKAELLDDGYILKVTYDNNDEELYTNYVPGNYEEPACFLANYLGADRKREFSDWIINSFEEYLTINDDNAELTQENVISSINDNTSIIEYVLNNGYVFYKYND